MVNFVNLAKLVLIEDRREQPAEPAAAPLKRYRLARLRLDGRSDDPDARFEHLRHAYD